jgi:hypothetical protein
MDKIFVAYCRSARPQFGDDALDLQRVPQNHGIGPVTTKLCNLAIPKKRRFSRLRAGEEHLDVVVGATFDISPVEPEPAALKLTDR